jgi:hypothetical protein
MGESRKSRSSSNFSRGIASDEIDREDFALGSNMNLPKEETSV